MATLLSPGVAVREFDFSQVIPSVDTAAAAIVGQYTWGPVEDVTLIGTEVDLVKNFGKPADYNYIDWFSAKNFLDYSNTLNVVRVIADDALNATPNKMHFDVTTSTGSKNLIGYSINLAETNYWIHQHAFAQSNAELDVLPVDGVGPSFYFVENHTSPLAGFHRIYTNEISNDDGEAVVLSFYLKGLSNNRNIRVDLNSNKPGYNVTGTFIVAPDSGGDLGTVKFTSVGVNMDIGDATFDMEDLETGWYRCSIILENLPAHSSWKLFFTGALTSGTFEYIGFGGSGVRILEIFAPQLEVSSTVTDYSPTTYYKKADTVELLDVAPSDPNDIGQGILIKNDQLFDFVKHDESIDELMFVAKYPGALGNSLKVSIADKATFRNWKYKEYFTDSPDTSDFVANLGGSDDEIHLVVIDEDGAFTGIKNSILESYPFLSKAADARSIDNVHIFYGEEINKKSAYIRYTGPVTDKRLRDSSKIKAITVTNGGFGYSKETVRIEINGDGLDAFVDKKDIVFGKGGISSDLVPIEELEASNANTLPRYLLKTYSGAVASNMFIPLKFKSTDKDFATRASVGTYVNSSGYIATALTDVARMNYDFKDLSIPPVLLTEATATNLLTWSEKFDNWWRIADATLVTNVRNPAGAMSTWRIRPKADAINTQHVLGRSFTAVSPGAVVSFSFWAKLDGTSVSEADNKLHLVLGNYGWIDTIRVTVDLTSAATSVSPQIYTKNSTGALIQQPSGTFSEKVTVDHYRDGWKRITVTGKAGNTVGASFANIYLRRAIRTPTAPTYGGIYLWGTQVELGSKATSYIKSEGTAGIRAVDVATTVNTNQYAAYIKTRAADGWFTDNADIVVTSAGSVIANFDNQIVATLATLSGDGGDQYVKAYLSADDIGDDTKAFILRKEPSHLWPWISFIPTDGQIITGSRSRSIHFRHAANQSASANVALTFTSQPGTIPAVGVAYLNNKGFIDSVVMSKVGKNYSGTVTATPSSGSYQAFRVSASSKTGLLPITQFNNGIIEAIKVTDGGYDYTEALVTIVDEGRPAGVINMPDGTVRTVSAISGGTGATATVTLESTAAGAQWALPSFDENNKVGRKFKSLKSGYGGTFSFSGGSLGSYCQAGEFMKGWNLFKDKETTDVSLLISGDCGGYSAGSFESNIITKHIIDNIAEYRKDCVAFFSPQLLTIDGFQSSAEKTEDVVRYKDEIGRSSSYVVFDSGWMLIYDSYNEKYRKVPLNSAIAGLCALNDYTNDVWWSPAGFNRGKIKNVISLLYNPNQTERDELYKNKINPVVTFRGDGTVLYGDRTGLNKTSAFSSINVRRLFIMLEKAISNAAKYQLFEFNDTFTRSAFTSMISERLNTVKAKRGIIDFYVQCDESNNTPDVIDASEFVASIYIKPARSINFITLNFVAVRTGVNFSTVVGQL